MDNGEQALARLDAAEKRGERGGTPEAWDFEANYWLARPAFSKDFAAEVWRRFKKHSEQWTAEGDPIAQAVWKSYRTYHGISTTNPLSGSADIDLVENGEFGELLSMSINHYRSLIRHKLALNTAQRAAWDPQARTSGADAMKQVRLTRNICDYYWTAKRFDQRNYDQAELMEMAGVGFCPQGWDYNGGLKDEGDVWAQTVPPWEMCHQQVRSYGDCRWWIFVRWESRADWAARKAEKQPDVAKRLWELGVDEMFTCGVNTLRDDVSKHETDQIPLLYVYVSPSTSCPHGRLAIIAQPDMAPLVDTPMPYGRVAPVSRMCAAEYSGTAVPLANSWSMLPLMDGLYVAVTALITRLDFGAIPDLFVDEDTELEQGDLGGLNLLKMNREAAKPTLIDALQIPNVLPELIKMLVATMEAMTGINSVTRGQPDPNITSGSMAALIQAMSAQYNSAEDRAYNMALAELGTHLISIVQRMASEGLLVSIAGEDERYSIQKFKAEDLNQITRVEVKVIPGLLKTLGGKMQIADKLLDQKLINAEDYLAFLETGTLSDLTSPATDQLSNIKSENERMRRGETVKVLLTDNPYLHMQGHACELDTDARDDDAYTQRVLLHIKEHFTVANDMSLKTPDMCTVLGWQPFQQAAAIAAKVQEMQGGGSMPTPAAPTPEGKAEPGKNPGPAPEPKGKEPSEAAPAIPEPSKPAAPAAPQQS